MELRIAPTQLGNLISIKALNISIHNRTIRSVRQNCWQTVARLMPMSKERMALSRTYDLLLGAASIATRSSSSVAFSALGWSSGVRNAHVQSQGRSLYNCKMQCFADFSIRKFLSRIALAHQTGRRLSRTRLTNPRQEGSEWTKRRVPDRGELF